MNRNDRHAKLVNGKVVLVDDGDSSCFTPNMRDNDYRIAKSPLKRHIVMTSFLPTDMSLWGAVELHFETLVFPYYPGSTRVSLSEVDGYRYETLDEANAGHYNLVQKWKKLEADGTDILPVSREAGQDAGTSEPDPMRHYSTGPRRACN